MQLISLDQQFTTILFLANKSRPLDSPGVVVTDEAGKEAPGFVPPHPEANSGKDDAASWRRPGSLRARPTTR